MTSSMLADTCKGYTHAARGELEEAEKSARLMLEIVDRHTAILHLPITFTLAEASRRLLRTTAERSGRPVLRGLHVDALHVASSTLSFGRPRQPSESGGFGAAGMAAGGISGWCMFGGEILAAFDRASGGDGGRHVAKVKGRFLCSWTGCCQWIHMQMACVMACVLFLFSFFYRGCIVAVVVVCRCRCCCSWPDQQTGLQLQSASTTSHKLPTSIQPLV